MNDFGEKLKKLRTKNDDTLRQLGAKLNIDHSNLSKIERGERKPNIELLQSICKLYNTPMSYFLGEVEFVDVPEQLKEEGVVRISIDKSLREDLTDQDIKDALELIRDLKRDGKIDFNKLNEIQSRK
ncbi:helix-turn-helix domain-containing protein [Fredinandcohnia sp. 179-A 10B2 NHS]|uniref:helix-turn-helix domain-containing protein n=1 Tax=Fredinandcohnia sp. 179-A 10B2 NHS TaxID=3235176 RepID=UPI0039A0BB64